MAWTDSALRDALKRYEQACVAAGCAPRTLTSYVTYASWFLDWRIGDSHTRGAEGPRDHRSKAATIDELTAAVAAYESDLRRAGRAPRAVQTYMIHASQFVRWLDGRFEPCGRLSGTDLRRATIAGTVQTVPVSAKGPASRASDVTWAWEGNVQATVVAWLVTDGWTVDHQADTRAGDHGVDILARRGAERLAVEVKGYPQATYARGVRAGEPKRWHPGAQARTYFGTGLHAAIIQRDRTAGGQVALAVPDMQTYRSLFDQVRSALRDLGIRGLLVHQDGSVSEVRL